MIVFARTVSALLIATAVACGGDEPIENGETGPISMAEWTTLCHGVCARDLGCDPTVNVDACNASCVARFSDAFRADAARDVQTCLAQRACDVRDDTCEICTPTATHAAYAEACRAQLASCSVSLDRECAADGRVCYLRPTVAAELIDCLPTGVTCVDALDCLDGVYQRHGVSPP